MALEKTNSTSRSSTEEMRPCDDFPRSMRDPAVKARRRAMLELPHVSPLTRYVRGLRSTNSQEYGEVPDFDPFDGGVNARVLFLFEKPGPMADASGFISRNNDDPTASATYDFMKVAQLPRGDSCIWNVVPGWDGSRKIDREDLNRGAVALFELLKILTELKVVVLVGKKAQGLARKDPIRTVLTERKLQTIPSAHPSPIVRASARASWDQIPSQWAEAKRFLN